MWVINRNRFDRNRFDLETSDKIRIPVRIAWIQMTPSYPRINPQHAGFSFAPVYLPVLGGYLKGQNHTEWFSSHTADRRFVLQQWLVLLQISHSGGLTQTIQCSQLPKTKLIMRVAPSMQRNKMMSYQTKVIKGRHRADLSVQTCLSSFQSQCVKDGNLLGHCLKLESILHWCFRLNDVIGVLFTDWPPVLISRWTQSIFWDVFTPLGHHFPNRGCCQMHSLCYSILC